VLWMALAGLAALAPASARAAAWSVDDTTDTPTGQACPGVTNCSLREAVTSTEANPGADAILISAGTYPLPNGQLTITQDLTVAKVGAGVATIDGNNTSRIFDVTGGDFVLRFLTVTRGRADAGPGVGEGGAIRAASGTTVQIQSANLTANSAAGDTGALGGAISSEGAVSVRRADSSTTQSSLTGNSVTSSAGPADGGAIADRGGTLSIGVASLFTANTASGATGRGGAIYSEVPTTLTQGVLTANHATGSSAYGGAVAMNGAAIEVTRTTLSGNMATATGAGLTTGGGAVAAIPGALGPSAVTLTMSTLANNSTEVTGSPSGSVAAGGAVYNDTSGGTTVSTSTVTGNAVTATGASTAQGAAFSGSASGGTVSLASSIVAENTGPSQCAQATLVSSGYNVLGSFTGCGGAPLASDATGVADAGLSPLASNGGPNQTRLVQTGSPALDRVPSAEASCAGGPIDQRGQSRPLGAGCDSGAAESTLASLTAIPAALDWGNVPMSGAPDKTVTLSNSGDLEAVAPAFAVAAPFSASGCAGGVPAASGGVPGTCSIAVGAAPSAPGVFGATLGITAGATGDTVDLDAVGFGPTTMPAITPPGGVTRGAVLTLSDGVWTGSPTGFSRQWVRCDADGASNCTDVAGQTATTYATTADDDGHRLRVRTIAHSATVDSDPVTTAPSGLISAPAPEPPAPTPAPTPAPATTSPAAPESTPTSPSGAIVRCSGRELTILDFRPNGSKVTVRGLALTRRSGQTVTLRAGAKPVGTTTVAADGSFTATVPLPRSDGRPRLTADVQGSSSQAFAIERRFTIVARKRAGNRVRVTARVTGGRRGATVTLRRQVSCGRSERYGTAKLGKGGTFTIALPLPTGDEGVALYRAVAPIAGATTFTLPIAVTASG
jgi:hypothetical protein